MNVCGFYLRNKFPVSVLFPRGYFYIFISIKMTYFINLHARYFFIITYIGLPCVISHSSYGNIDLSVSRSLTSTFIYIYICCVGKILLDIKLRRVLLILNSYKWLQIDWAQRLGSWMCTVCTVINSIYYSNQCGTMNSGGE